MTKSSHVRALDRVAEASNKIKTNKPDNPEKTCPKKIFFGCAKGLSWTAITSIIVAPKGGINHM